MINLFTSYYNHPSPERQAEIDECLKRNCETPHINRVFILRSYATEFPEGSRVGVVNIPFDGKPSYADFFTCINEASGTDDINIIANADIEFDETIKLVEQMKHDECYALSRWEIGPDGEKIRKQIQVFGDSQDAWIFKGPIRPVEFADFPLGKMGCDNRIAWELKEAGYKVTNPSKSIHAWHRHASNIRGYNPAVRNPDTVVPPPYLTIPLTTL